MPPSKPRRTRDEIEAERKAQRLEARRRIELAELEAFNRRAAATQRAEAEAKAGKRPRIMSKPRPMLPASFDPEAGRWRFAKRYRGPRPAYASVTVLPFGAVERFGATLACDHCGMGMLTYRGRGAYFCARQRLVNSHHGCERYSYGPCNPDETEYTDDERQALEDDDALPM